MAPAKVDEDPVTAEYDIYLTNPALQDEVFLIQYPNRDRRRPYSWRVGTSPERMRIKPKSGYLEVDIETNANHNYNKYQGLKWGDAMRTGREMQSGENATYGMASGFPGPRPGGARRTPLKDQVDREIEILNDLAEFEDAERAKKPMHTQTLGGQIIRHDSVDEAGKPHYFVGAFRGSELHLTKVNGTVQMRPQFHYLDAEDQRNRLASREHAAASGANLLADDVDPTSSRNKADAPRAVHQKYKDQNTANPKGELEQRELAMKKALQAAAEEQWTKLDYVDEDEEEAYRVYHERMFVEDVDNCKKLQSGMSNEEYLDAISSPGKESPTRRRKRRERKKEAVEVEDED